MIDVPRLRRWLHDAPDTPMVVLIVLAGCGLLYLGRSMTFWQDEWGAIAFDGGPADFLRPFNEHWFTIPLLLYRATFAVVGLHSHLPYMAQVIAFHIAAVAAAYVLVRARAGSVVATVGCIPLLILGSGAENLFWGFQTGFTGSVAFGLWALVLIERPGRATSVGAALLLLASLMSSGMGLPFLVVAFGRTILDARLRWRAVAVVPPTVAYLVWYATLGHDAVTQPGHLASVGAAVRFVARGIGHAVGAFTGLEIVPGGDLLALVAFTVAAAATGWAVLKIPRPPALAAGALLGIPAMYAIIGLVRAQLASDFATRSRYVYVAAFLIVIAFADWLPWLRDRVRGRRGHLALRGALAVILVVIIASNVIQLMAIQARFEANSDLTRAYVELAVEHQGEPWVDPASVLLGMPPLPALLAILERSGSPTRDDLFPALARDPGAPARETALLRMTGAGFHATPAIGRGSPVAFEVTASRGVTVATDDGCLSLHGSGRDASVTVVVPTGTRVRLTATDGVAGRAVLGFELPPSRAIELAAPAATPVDLVLPDLGDGSSWIVRLEFRAASGTIQACPIAVD